ncbi:MAG: TVP38/TMEM64 family protein [Desulfofustis sp.]
MTSASRRKVFILVALIILAGLFFFLDLPSYLNLEYLKESQSRFQQLYYDHRIAVIAAYMVIYILVTALSLPGAAVMTLAGGALFGLFVGTVVVSFASTIGATCAFLASRFFLRDWVQGRFGARLQTVNEGMRKEGAFYLFSLRLIPVFPFFIINLLMGLTKMRVGTYFWVSQLGMLPATAVYLNAGNELAKIDSLATILSPGLVGSFVLLGLFPITVKKVMERVRRSRDMEKIP